MVGPGGEMTVEVRVSAETDDAEEGDTGPVQYNSSDLEMVSDFEGGDQTIGIRFASLDIPPGATIVDAYVQFQVDEPTSTTTNLSIRAEAADNAPGFTTAPNSISSRPMTSASTAWSPSPWTVVGEVGPDQRTPPLNSVVQEVTSRGGWTANNSLVLIITGTGERVAESYDGDPLGAPLLHVEFLPPPVVTIDSPVDGATFAPGASIDFAGSVVDEDRNLAAGLVWTSDVDGVIGSGASFTTDTLSAGVHVITAEVTDSGGAAGSATVTITINVNQVPVVTIDGPVDGASFTEADSVSFAGTATDAEDGVLTAGLVWTSDVDGVIGSGASFTTSTLSAGVHVITAEVTDSGGAAGSATVTITINVNQVPVVTIDGPVDGASFTEADSVSFAGTATDAEDGVLTAGLVWTSDVDGVIGSGASFTTDILTAGVHVITAEVTDSGGAAGSATITITINVNQVPVVTIDGPVDGASFTEADSVSFAGTATDAEDGVLTAGLVWTSDVDGVIGSGASFTTSILSAGVHVITAEVTDSGGAAGSATITITITVNQVPVVTIDGPVDGPSFTEADSVSFAGTATDAEDGVLTADLVWTSDVDGVIGSGASFTTSILSAGVHVITAEVTDSGGAAGSATITITITVNQVPVVTIDGPVDGASFTEADSVSFAGTATDAEDGVLTTGLVWTSDVDGVIGSGASFTTDILSAGVHVITAEVTDSGGAVGSATITITITVNQVPVVTIDGPVDGASFTEADSVSFAGTATDAEDGVLTTGLVWTSDVDGVIGSGASFTTDILSAGVHVITAEETDSGGAVGSATITITITAGEPSTITVSAAADARVLEANPGTNYGTSVRLDVDSPGEESYIRFSVSGVTGTVQTATLRLFVRNGSSNGPSLYNTASSWTETGITWNNRPAPTGGAIADVGTVTVNTWAEYDLTGQVTGNGTYDFVLLPDSRNGVRFNSREANSPPGSC